MRLRSLLLISALVLSGCTTQVQDPIAALEAGADVFEQQVSWTSCEDGFECATVGVPLDWLNPDGDIVKISLIRNSASKDKEVIFVNPGGPGVSGTKWLRDGFMSIGTSSLRENFQLIGFDPRGVGDSSGVTCVDQELKDKVYYEQSPYEFGSAEDIKYSRDLLTAFAVSCQSLGFDTGLFNTQQSARDLDLLRHLVGQEQLNYLGFSYGTLLGSTYAALFPERVGKFVLDGAIDPNLSEADMLLSQVAGFDMAFRSYMQDCLTRLNCPFRGDVDGAIQVVADFLQERETTTLPTQLDRELSLQATLAGIIAALYSQDSWIYLTQAFTEALDGDGTTMLLLADFYNDRDVVSGYTSNLNEANLAISCADGRVTEAEATALNQEFLGASAVFGRYFSYPNLACEGWPEAKSVVPLDYSVPLANGPLVIGTTGDPATPYSQAVALSELLDGAVFLTFQGEGHTAYGSSSCVNAIVDSFFEGVDLGTGDKTCI